MAEPLPSVFTIAPHAPFLDVLADALLDGRLLPRWPREGAFWLSDITIYLPTRRARLTLIERLAERAGPALLLPDIRTLGGETGEEDLFLPPFDREPLPPAQSRLRRQLMLAAEIEVWTRKEHTEPDRLPPGEILARAAALGDLIDDFRVAGIPLDALDRFDPGDQATHWQQSKEFLQFALKTWPELLAHESRVDASELRNLKLARQAAALPHLFGAKPVIAAGSTGSIPASANLLAAIASLPLGALVLPGFNTQLGKDQVAALRNAGGNPHGHPQYGLVKLLDRLSVPPAAVTELAPDRNGARSRLLNLALGLAEDTARWPDEAGALFVDPIARAQLDMLSIAAAANEAEEALAVALAARDALGRGLSVGIISPDRNLARRISGHLQRFEVDVDDAAGTPLFQSRTGRLLRQILTLALNPVSPVDLMALLHNRHVTFGRDRDEMARLARLIDLGLLRGLPPAGNFETLAERAGANASYGLDDRVVLRLSEKDAGDVGALLGAVATSLNPLMDCLQAPFGPVDFVAALDKALARSIDQQGAEPAERPGLDEWRTFVLELGQSGLNRPLLDAASAVSALAELTRSLAVRTPLSGRPDIAIWGQLEARLQNRDLMILCGLNETVWPEVADPGPWMGRAMRMGVGLEPPERLHGLAAHDFLMAAGHGEVIFAYAGRLGTSPTAPSRLVERLIGFAGPDRAQKMNERGQKWVERARALDLPEGPVRPSARPAPRPPADRRARVLSVTEAEKLFFSPYDIYARRTLSLYPLEPLGQPVSPRDRGTILHQVFADFVIENLNPAGISAHRQIMDLAAARFVRLDNDPDHRDIWLKRFEVSAEMFLAFERERQRRIAERHAEVDISCEFQIGGEPFILKGRADRIDLLEDGTCEILDFKTGNPPDKKLMQQLSAPQLPLEAFILSRGGFEKLGRRQTSALKYIKIANGPDAFIESDFVTPDGLDVIETAERTFEHLTRFIQHFLLSGDTPMSPDIRPRPGQRFAGDYDHLARKAEWAGVEGEGDE
ncbi:MAG: double-strand break repair protein AddB [Hyphomicrobiaceae bacterium]|nr:double-strand break repair protein AddB [Hyphomicrobiaceae bacterium]